MRIITINEDFTLTIQISSLIRFKITNFYQWNISNIANLIRALYVDIILCGFLYNFSIYL